MGYLLKVYALFGTGVLLVAISAYVSVSATLHLLDGLRRRQGKRAEATVRVRSGVQG